MSDRSGTDPATERRKLRPDRETADDGPVGEALVDGFDAASETLLASIPFLTATAIRDDAAYSFLVVFALAGLAVGLATVRGDRVERLPPWPPNTARSLGVRVVWYNLALPVTVWIAGNASVGPGEVAWADGPVLVPAAVAALVTVFAGLAVPSLVARVR